MVSPEDFVQRQVADIDRRLDEIDEALRGWNALVDERDRLRAARGALAGDEPGRPRLDAETSPRPARQRAPRGENKRRILEAVGKRAGASVSELAEASGLAQPTASSVLRQLDSANEVERVDLGGGRTGYRAAGDSSASQPESEPGDQGE